jgi:hypothetical protein
MANQRLQAAMKRAGAEPEAVALAVGVDPKTVKRWMWDGRPPHPQTRVKVAKYLNEEADFLWPEKERPKLATPTGTTEIVNTYSHRNQISTGIWWRLLTQASHNIDLLGYTLYFLPMQHTNLAKTLKKKCESGCHLRIAIADPNSPHVAYRDDEEDLAMTLKVRIFTTLKYFRELVGVHGVEMRFQDIPLYNSVFRFDKDMIVTPHLYAANGAEAPALHLRSVTEGGLCSRFGEHFNAVWNASTDIPAEYFAKKSDMKS